MIDKNIEYPMVGVGKLDVEDGQPKFVLYTNVTGVLETPLYYSKTGVVTTMNEHIMRFWTASEAIGLRAAFTKVADQVAATGKVEDKDDLILCYAVGEVGSGFYYYGLNAGGSFMSRDVKEAFTFKEPQQAEDVKPHFAQLFEVPTQEAVDRMRIVTHASLNTMIAAREMTEKSAQRAEEAAVESDTQYLIRFIDPKQENDLEGDITAPCWVRYYCEGTLVDAMEAAEWFERSEDAIDVSAQLREAGMSGQLYDASEALMLKLKVLGIIGQSPSTNGVQVTFRDSVLIQVLAVSGMGGPENWKWNTFFQDSLRWVFDEEVSPDEDEETDETN
jgi:hypothetical protein